MKKLILIAIVGFGVLFSQAKAETLEGGFPACISEDLFDQIIHASATDDRASWDYLLKNGCFITKSGISISVLDSTWTGKAKVRAYIGDQAVVLWTNTESVVK